MSTLAIKIHKEHYLCLDCDVAKPYCAHVSFRLFDEIKNIQFIANCANNPFDY